MADPVGYASFIGVGIETTPATPVLSQVEIDFISENLRGTGEPIRRRSINRLRTAKGAVMGGYRAEGDISFEVTPDKWTKLLYAVLAGLTTTGAADPYTHVFKTASSLKALTVQVQRDDQFFVYPGCYPSRLTFRAVIDAILEASISLASRAKEKIYSSEQSDGAIAASTQDPFVFHQATVSLGGTANTDTNNWEVSIDTGLLTPKGLGAGRAPNRAHPGDSVVTGSFDMVFDSVTQHRRWMGAAADTYPIDLGTALQTLAIQLVFTASASRVLTIDIPTAYYTASEAPVSGRGDVIVQRCQFGSLYNTGQATDIKVTLLNQESNSVVGTAGSAIP